MVGPSKKKTGRVVVKFDSDSKPVIKHRAQVMGKTETEVMEANMDYLAAVVADPTDAEVYTTVGLIKEKCFGDYINAEKAFHAALEANPASLQAALNLEEFMLNKAKRESGKEIIELGPGKHSNSNDAQKAFKIAIGIAPTSPIAHTRLSGLYFSTHRENAYKHAMAALAY